MKGGGAPRSRRATKAFGGAPLSPPPSVEPQRQLVNSGILTPVCQQPSLIDWFRSSLRCIHRQISPVFHHSIYQRLHLFSFLPISFRAHHVPSIKDVTGTLKFLLSAVEFPRNSAKWEEDLVFYLISPDVCQRPETPLTAFAVLAVKTRSFSGKILEVLEELPQRWIQVIVVTDGEQILDLGDLGCQVQANVDRNLKNHELMEPFAIKSSFGLQPLRKFERNLCFNGEKRNACEIVT